MGTVFELNRRGVFSIETAREILPLVFKITSDVDHEFKVLKEQIIVAQSQQKLERASELEEMAQCLISRWESKIQKLGLEPKGVWLVDFNSGDGYFCWKYPELDIKFWHGYQDGFSGRKPIDSLTNLAPDL